MMRGATTATARTIIAAAAFFKGRGAAAFAIARPRPAIDGANIDRRFARAIRGRSRRTSPTLGRHFIRKERTAQQLRMTSSGSCNPTEDGSGLHLRILCLHGKGGDGDRFVDSSLKPLRSLVEKRLADLGDEGTDFSCRWEALTAPHEIVPEGNGFSWWTMPPGIRSYNAEEYEGFGKSESAVLASVYSTKANASQAECNFDIILGHSQGAILTAALLSIHNEKLTSSDAPLGYILNGVAWPNPYRDSLASLAANQSGPRDSLPRMLFVIGTKDSINPTESAMKVHDSFKAANFANVSIVNHNGGHSVPIGRDEDSVGALEDVVEWIIDVAKEKARRLVCAD
ncbi:hypothetical protein ACHAWF_010262 [Thalassiosira exigua]